MISRAFTQHQDSVRRNLGAGFTLVETIVVIAVTTLITLTLGTLLVYFYKTNAYTLEQSTQVAQARRGVEDAMKDLREASYGSDGSYPIATASTSQIAFYANVNNDVNIERITYTRIGGTLYRTTLAVTGNPPTYVGGTYATSTVATSVTNNSGTPIFQYYNESGNLLAQPVDTSKVASVKTTLVIDVNVNRAPIAFTLSGAATLRNLKSQL